MPVLFFCPCSEPLESLDDLSIDSKVPQTIGDPRTHHALEDLYFCLECQVMKCRKCSEPQIEFKFCARCHFQADGLTRVCQKNCFDCPICRAPLTVKSNTHEATATSPRGKSFMLRCNSCSWSYNTGVETKPRPLRKILQDQQSSEEEALFKRLREYYALERDVRKFMSGRKLKPEDLAGRVSPVQLAKLSAGDKSGLPDFETVQDMPRSEKLFPQLHPLSTRISHKCKSCRQDLVKIDKSDFLSTKFYKVSTALDVLPEIDIYQLAGKLGPLKRNSTNNLCLNFSNNQESIMEVQVSSLTYLSSDLKPVQDSPEHGHLVKLTLPCQNFQIGARPEKVTRPEVLLQTIPTIVLEQQDTKASRVELISKRSASMSKLSSTIDTTKTFPLDSGINWATIPLVVEIGEVELFALNIPLFVTIKTNIVKSCSFWIVLSLGNVTV